MLRLGGARPDAAWFPPVLMTDSIAPAGVPELVDAFDAHHAWLATSGDGFLRKRDRIADRLRMLTRDRILERLRDQPVGAVFNGLVDRVVCRTMSPGAAVDAVIAAIQMDPVSRRKRTGVSTWKAMS